MTATWCTPQCHLSPARGEVPDKVVHVLVELAAGVPAAGAGPPATAGLLLHAAGLPLPGGLCLGGGLPSAARRRHRLGPVHQVDRLRSWLRWRDHVAVVPFPACRPGRLALGGQDDPAGVVEREVDATALGWPEPSPALHAWGAFMRGLRNGDGGIRSGTCRAFPGTARSTDRRRGFLASNRRCQRGPARRGPLLRRSTSLLLGGDRKGPDGARETPPGPRGPTCRAAR
jgi:hypothetical protein